jgi:hypothetical protein
VKSSKGLTGAIEQLEPRLLLDSVTLRNRAKIT